MALATRDLAEAHEAAICRRWGRPIGSPVGRVFPLHRPFFEALANAEEGSPEARVATAGLFALRVMDHYSKVGNILVEPDAIEPKSLRGFIEALEKDEPLRKPLISYVNRLQRAPQDGIAAAVHDLFAVAEVFRDRGADQFAAEVYATIVRYADDDSNDRAVAHRAYRAIGRRLRARGESLEEQPGL